MHSKSLFLFLAAALLAALPAFPQGNPTGSLSGRVEDPEGLRLPGVVVTARSRELQGIRTATTSGNGDYIIPFLPSGDYTVTFELNGFQTLTRSERISSGQAVQLSVSMKLAAVTETVTVRGQPAGDFSQTAPVATSFKSDLLRRLPLARTILSAVDLAPGVHATGPASRPTISGAASFENLYLIDGVVAQRDRQNRLLDLFIEDALQETSISTAAVSAEFGRFAGGVVSAITKSGGNEFSGSLRTTFDNDNWVARTPFPGDSRTDDVVPTYEATVGGPVLKDKLWFFGAGRYRDLTQARTTNAPTSIPFVNRNEQLRYEGKLTYTASSRHTFKGAYMNIQEDVTNQFPNVMGALDLESLISPSFPQYRVSFNATGVLPSNVFTEAQYSRRKFTRERFGALSTDLIKGTTIWDRQRNDARYHSPVRCGVCRPESEDNEDILVKASYLLSTGKLGSHNLVLGFDAFNSHGFSGDEQTGSGYIVRGTTAIIRGTEVFPIFNNNRTTTIRWHPIFREEEGYDFRTYSGFINDSWRLSRRLSFNVGLRYDKNDGKNGARQAVVKDGAFSPRLAVTFDPKGDGAWTLNAGFGKYVTAIATNIADMSSPAGRAATFEFDYLGPAVNLGNPANPVSQDEGLRILFDWFFANGGTNRPTRGSPNVPGLTTLISENLASPNALEWTLGVSRRLGSRGLVRVDGIYRKFRDFYARRIDLTTGRVANDLGQVFDRAIIENSNDIERRYKGINLQISYRAADRLSLAGNYTLSRAEGNFDAEQQTSTPITSSVVTYPEYRDPAWNVPKGDLAIDQRHKARIWATYDVPIPSKLGELSLGVFEQIHSGRPYGALGSLDPRDFVANPGYANPPGSVEYFFTARDAFKTQTVTQTDLALNYSHKLGIGKRTALFFRGTIQNVFNERKIHDPVNIDKSVLRRDNDDLESRFQAFNPFTTQPVQGVHWDFGPSFGRPISRLAYQAPRTYQFSIGLRF